MAKDPKSKRETRTVLSSTVSTAPRRNTQPKQTRKQSAVEGLIRKPRRRLSSKDKATPVPPLLSAWGAGSRDAVSSSSSSPMKKQRNKERHRQRSPTMAASSKGTVDDPDFPESPPSAPPPPPPPFHSWENHASASR